LIQITHQWILSDDSYALFSGAWRQWLTEKWPASWYHARTQPTLIPSSTGSLSTQRRRINLLLLKCSRFSL
jgi:hypothetical protein